MRNFLLLLLAPIMFFILATSVLAAEEFSTSYDVSYNVGTDGTTDVIQKINLKNLTDKYYASNFSLSIGSTTVSDVVASNDAGVMETKIDSADKTTITITFNQQVTGLDKSQAFTLKFKSKDFAERLGKTWRVDLPRIPENANITKYNLVLNVPISFGDPTSIYPKPKTEKLGLDYMSFSYTKDQLEKTGVSINFGTSQVYDFNLEYDLENNLLFPSEQAVILPSNTDYQDIIINEINPAPINVVVDRNGNSTAFYKVSPHSKLQVKVSGLAKLYVNSKNQNKTPLSSSEILSLTKSDKYWEKDNPAIAATTKEIFKDGMPKTNREKAAAIYQYVVATLKYDSERAKNSNIQRLGALTALNNPDKSVCMEFTDLLIALLRSANVPARELDGFAYSQNKQLRPLSFSDNLLHAWAEYFDPDKGWVMVDPTWENTSGGVDYFNKFDLAHFTMATRGSSADLPLSVDKVDVKVSESDFIPVQKLDVVVKAPEIIWAGFPGLVDLTITNNGNTASESMSTKITSTGFPVIISEDGILNVGILPVKASTTKQFNLKTPFSWKESQAIITIETDGQKIEKLIIIKPVYQSPLIFSVFGGGILLIIIGYGSVLAYHLYRNHKKPHG